MALFFNICSFTAMKMGPMTNKVYQSSFKIQPNTKFTLKILPKTSKSLPKWRNFAKSGHTRRCLVQESSEVEEDSFPGTPKGKKREKKSFQIKSSFQIFILSNLDAFFPFGNRKGENIKNTLIQTRKILIVGGGKLLKVFAVAVPT